MERFGCGRREDRQTAPRQLGLLRLAAGSLSWIGPPRVDLIAVQRRLFRSLQLAPASDPLVRQVKEGNNVVPGQQNTIQRAHGRHKIFPCLRLEHRCDHRIYGFVLHARQVERALCIGSLAAPAKGLFVARRKGCPPEIWDHIEIESLFAPLILGGVHAAYAHVDTHALERVRISEKEAFLAPRARQDLERKRLARFRVHERAVSQNISSFGEEPECGKAPLPILTGPVTRFERKGAVHDLRFDRIGERSQKFDLSRIRWAPMRGQLRTRKVALRVCEQVVIERTVDPSIIKKTYERLTYARVGKDWPACIEDESRHAGWCLDRQRLLDDSSLTQSGKVVTLRPSRRRQFAAKVDESGLEGFEHGATVAEVVHADFVKVVAPAIDGKVAPPIIRVALEGEALTRVH